MRFIQRSLFLLNLLRLPWATSELMPNLIVVSRPTHIFRIHQYLRLFHLPLHNNNHQSLAMSLQPPPPTENVNQIQFACHVDGGLWRSYLGGYPVHVCVCLLLAIKFICFHKIRIYHGAEKGNKTEERRRCALQEGLLRFAWSPASLIRHVVRVVTIAFGWNNLNAENEDSTRVSTARHSLFYCLSTAVTHYKRVHQKKQTFVRGIYLKK